jgi:hypothetical protein
MRKIYIAPETELIVTNIEGLLNINSTITNDGTGENNPGGSGNDNPGDGGSGDGTDIGARQHNNWMWDTMEDEF